MINRNDFSLGNAKVATWSGCSYLGYDGAIWRFQQRNSSLSQEFFQSKPLVRTTMPSVITFVRSMSCDKTQEPVTLKYFDCCGEVDAS